MKHLGFSSLLAISLLFVSLQGMAQHKSPTWFQICNHVKNYYHAANNEKKQAASFLLENAPYHLTKVNDTLSSYYAQLEQINKDNWRLPISCFLVAFLLPYLPMINVQVV